MSESLAPSPPGRRPLARTLVAIMAAALCLVGPNPLVGAVDIVSLRAEPGNSHSMLLGWTIAPTSGDSLALSRKTGDGWRLIDRFDAHPSGIYTDDLLWQDTTYSYRIQLYDGDALVASQTASARTPTQRGSFPRLYGPHSFWNQPIPAGAPLADRSEEMVDYSLVRFANDHVASNGRFYPEANFSITDSWGVPIAYADPVHSKRYEIGCTRYGCDEDVSFRLPRYAALSTGSDHRLSVLESGTGLELDLWAASYSDARDRWTAGSRYTLSASPLSDGSLCGRGMRCNGAVAAGWAALGGAIRPEEVAQGEIEHALSLTTPTTRRDFIACPATHEDGNTRWDPAGGSYPIPIGARLQLDPDFDVPVSWPQWKKEIARALKVYGGYVSDTGGSVAIKGEATSVARGYDSWGLAGLPRGADRGLGDFPWGRMRVLELERNQGDGRCR